jgi:hypothetical protein
MTNAQPLTFKEAMELSLLNSLLFGLDAFVVITPEMESTKEYKRQQVLTKKLQAYRKFKMQVALN